MSARPWNRRLEVVTTGVCVGNPSGAHRWDAVHHSDNDADYLCMKCPLQIMVRERSMTDGSAG